MDRESYAQLDRIEEKTEEALNLLEKVVEERIGTLIVQFLEHEINQKEGELHFLAKDERIQNFIQRIRNESETIRKTPNTQKGDEYTQNDETNI